jgi:glycosyltransferase involved in cell wall biosynthesis
MLASKAVVVNTRATQRLIQECFPNLGNEKFVLIPHPDDSDDYANGKRFSSVGQDSAAEALPVVLYISHFAPYKGHLELIRAMRAVFADGIRFNLLVTVAEGDWPAGYEPLMREIVLAGLRRYVVNLGRISQRDAIAAYGRASVFVFPSYVESFGLPLRDALANALPIVAADTEVNREIAGGGALYYPVGDTSALAAHLSHLLTNSSTKERLSTQGKLHYASTRTTKSDNAAAVFSLLRSLC